MITLTCYLSTHVSTVSGRDFISRAAVNARVRRLLRFALIEQFIVPHRSMKEIAFFVCAVHS